MITIPLGVDSGTVGWLSWNLDPLMMLAVLAAGVVYLRLIGHRRSRFAGSEPVETRRVVSFFAALAVASVALFSPLAALANNTLLMAHTLQHLLLTVIVPPLVYYGLPPWLIAAFARSGRPWRIWRALTQFVVAFVLFHLPFALSHVPVFFELTLDYGFLHSAEHLVFVATALLVWWPLMAPGRPYGQLTPGVQLLYLFVQWIPGQITGALIVNADQSLYATYAAASRVWGMSAAFDQQIGGLIMWLGMIAVYIAAMIVVFFRWAAGEDRDQRERYARASSPGGTVRGK